MDIKKTALISFLVVLSASCGNSNQTEAIEEKQRDSAISEQKSEDEQIVAELMRQDSIDQAQEQASKDSAVK